MVKISMPDHHFVDKRPFIKQENYELYKEQRIKQNYTKNPRICYHPRNFTGPVSLNILVVK